MKRLFAAAIAALFASPLAAQTPSAAPAAPAAVDYAADASWICLPGRQDACARPLSTAPLTPSGYGPVATPARAENPPIDCFYVYPTVSRDAELNSDLNAGATEEVGATIVQFARFGSLCRTFAPLYRQATLASIPRAIMGGDVTANFNLAYGDVRAAFHYYLEHHNNGRPFVLIGHSQGSIHLSRLIASEIDGTPLAARMVSALLIGWTIEVPQGGAVVGGTFRQIPLCTRAGETGCVVTFMTFRAGSPPPDGALMGRATRAGMTAACTNPAALAGGSASLDSIWFAAPSSLPGATPITWSTSGPPAAPFLTTHGLVSGECRHDGAKGYLAITVNADPSDTRTDEIPGDVRIAGMLQPGWGLHTADMPLTQGDLMEVVAAQSATATRRR
ncbi:MAG TPA: DUF3089 domain-containing protein [Allosphingosinicella sp.]